MGVFTHGAIAVAGVFGIMVIHNTFGAQNGWFYMWQNSVPQLIFGLCQVLSNLAIIEISPPGLEATAYELIISCTNSAISLGSVFTDIFSDQFDMDDISAHWTDSHCSAHSATPADPICHTYTRNLTNATTVTLCINVVCICIFMWFMPKNAAQCREWASKSSWKNWMVGSFNLVMYIVFFSYANSEMVIGLTQGNETVS